MSEKKNVLITGASGLVGSHIVDLLNNSGKYCIYAVGSNTDRLATKFAGKENTVCLSNRELLEGEFDLSKIDYLIHGAFTRSNDAKQVTTAMTFASDVFKLASKHPGISIINLSTRSVYKEPDPGTLNTEDSEVVPAGLIGVAKYATELMLEAICGISAQPYTILRLASVNEIKTENTMVRPLNVFVDCMLTGKPIRVVGGMQVMSYIDPIDIATAVESLLNLPSSQWDKLYNIGTGWKCTDTLLNIAKKVCAIGTQKYNIAPVDINVEPKDVNMHAGMDISRIEKATGWQPQYSMEDMIERVFELKLSAIK